MNKSMVKMDKKNQPVSKKLGDKLEKAEDKLGHSSKRQTPTSKRH